MTDLIVMIVLIAILGGAGYCVYRSQKSGAKCIGCPAGGNCSGSCTCCGDGEKADE